MADITFTPSPSVFPEGTSVSAYPISNWPGRVVDQAAAPVGAAADTAPVTSGSVTLDGLTEGGEYVAYALVGGAHRYVRFIAGANRSGALTERLAALETKILLPEIADPASPPADHAYIFARATSGSPTEVVTKDSDGTLSSLTHVNGIRLTHSANQNVASGGTGSALAFDTEGNTNPAMHSTVTTNSRITVPMQGFYVISGSAEFAANATGLRRLIVRRNGATGISNEMFVQEARAAASGTTRISLGCVIRFAAGDFFQLVAFQDSGATLAVTGNGNHQPHFSAVWLGHDI